MGRAMVVHTALQEIVSEPLRESVRNAAERADACGPGGKRKKEKGITQTLYGKAVDELIPALEAQEKRREEAACEKKRKRQESESARASKHTEEISKACANLQAKKDADKLSIADLVTLLKWKGAEVPKDRSKNGKPAMARAWIALAVSDEAIGAEASKAAAAPAADPPAAPAKKQKKRQAAESDDEEEESDDESDDEDEESEDESEAEEEYAARAVLKKKGQGKQTQYLVDWEPERDENGKILKKWPPSWQPAAFVSDDLVDAYEAAHKKRK